VEEGVRRLKTLEAWALAVTEFVRGMSLAEWGLLVAVASLLVGIGALWYARRAARVSEQELEVGQRTLELAEEQAALRPELRLSATYSRIGKTTRHADGVLEFSITNVGQTTANNVRCSLQLVEPHVVLFLDTRPPTGYTLGGLQITPAEPYRRSLNVRVQEQGRGKVHYRCWCDEAPPTEGDIEYEIEEMPPPWWEEDEPPDFTLDKSWLGTPRVGEQITFHITATNSGGKALALTLWEEWPSSMQYGSHTGLGASFCDLDPLERHAKCEYEAADTDQTYTMELTMTPTEAGTFDTTVYLQYVIPQRGNEGKRIQKVFPVTVLPARSEASEGQREVERDNRA
jgi:hypothetical protein